MKEDVIIEILCDVFDLDQTDINLDSTPEQIDKWDSLANINIIIALEDELETKFRLQDLEEIKTLNDFFLLAKKYSG